MEDCAFAAGRRAAINRRRLLSGAGALLLAALAAGNRKATGAFASPVTLLSSPLELVGDWGGSPRAAAARVVSRTREVCLSGVALLSDRQPDRLRVEEHSSGPPAIWLHDDPPNTAWIIVDIGARDWCKLAYQFGHELGHVLGNSWRRQAAPRPPTQWLEEALAEAFSIRGLALLAASWEARPPFAGDAAFAGAIRAYRTALVEKYQRAEIEDDDVARWFRTARGSLPQGVSEAAGPAILAIVAEYDRAPACVADLGALNRWPERTALPIEDYLGRWQASCAEIGAPGLLPSRLKRRFGIAA